MNIDEHSSLADDLAIAALSLARRLAAGATIWCVAPQWPAHAHHVAVEFVHPVIVGKRAVPAVCVEGPDLVAAMRLLARPGDVVVAIASAADENVRAVMRRGPTWDLTSFWLGGGPRPPAGAADHVIWNASADAALAAQSGELVVLYHLLWELTHVAFEHPGLLRVEPECDEEVCTTCADEGRLAEVACVLGAHMADVIAAGQRETIDVSLIDAVAPGDLVLVHGGVAIATVQERPA